MGERGQYDADLAGEGLMNNSVVGRSPAAFGIFLFFARFLGRRAWPCVYKVAVPVACTQVEWILCVCLLVLC